MNVKILKKHRPQIFEFVFISSFWILLFTFPIIFQKINNPTINWSFIFNLWIGYLPLLIVFFINRALLIPWVLFKSKPFLYLIMVFILIATTAYGVKELGPQEITHRNQAENAQSGLIFPNEKQHPVKPARNNPSRIPKPAYPPYINFVLLSILLVGFDTGMKLSVKGAKVEGEKAKLEKENIKSELAFLRNQISPHFLMNTLNNIHSLADFDVKEAKSSIAKLSVLMRHLLYESDDSPTALTKEIKFIESYINLMQLRFSDDVEVSLKLPKSIPDLSIPPLLFTNILENAFKYGISYNDRSFVHIIINCTDTHLEFSVTNSIHKKSTDAATQGIGIENTKKRLKLLYNNNYTFTYTEKEDVFNAIINIPI